MPRFEYKVVPAPRKGEKVKGARTPTDRFAHALTQMMNELGRDGWDYLRAETLPCEERVGFTGKTTTYQNLLIFRRVVEEAQTTDRLPADLPAFFRPEGTPAPSALASSLRPGADEGQRGLTAQAPEGHAPSLGPARGGLAAE
ncbi:DUF4177 domain-containing protein [Cereibacter azotoformans]|uniref:Uncharacterized protein DUF4177 n=1 Tax=Cereibacter azotoformans TaxID=43057 RepID=A0A2T5JYU1_9RHOB|nr:DUF4177 domain-containing protein [Cereibacter azotoformans]AXQ94507.1 DUF4177 domain-containing protein [Cereibacter sphaeroides]MBO4170656.1 DUF4177 domain-containing protein [Cereibacter azotoformans]PTR15342.1 uncharacterized protein DUF4177 [Cereibacter azotoformans]UIJ30058.1 DUF4177 domain-containing protein [Cereibacter azotoformans]